MAYPMVSICRKSDEYSARYDQKGVAAVMLSLHQSGAAGESILVAHCSILAV
jgi:hypothetical protein